MKAIYGRVSILKQVTDGYSIEDQIDKCKQIAGDDCVLFIDRGWTGEILERPQLMELLFQIKQGNITEVYVYDSDRLSRNSGHLQMIVEIMNQDGATVTFVEGHVETDTVHGKAMLGMQGVFNQMEKGLIKMRTMSGRKRKALEGKIVKNDNVFGYDYDRSKCTLQINKEESKIVELIFNLYLSGQFQGVNSLAHELTRRGIKTAKGKTKWHRQVVKQILTNETYKGIYYQNKYDTEGNYVRKQKNEKCVYKMKPKEQWIAVPVPVIIDSETFEAVQVKLQNAKRQTANNSKHNYLLSGLLRCGTCGETMTGRKHKDRKGNDVPVYECRKNYAGRKNNGCGRTITEHILNDYVWNKMVQFFLEPESLASYREQQQERQYMLSEIERVKQQIKEEEQGKVNLTYAIKTVGTNCAPLVEELNNTIKQINTLQNYLEELRKETMEHKDTNAILFQKATEYFKQHNSEWTKEEKKEILSTCLKEVIINKHGDPNGIAEIKPF